MRNKRNWSPVFLEVEEVFTHAAASKWLAGQNDEVRAVTSVTPSGGLKQIPIVEDGAYVDPTARLIGGMIIRAGCYVGPFAVVRLDEKSTEMPLVIGPDTNIQDCAVVHSDTRIIGSRVIVAHQAVVHGAAIEDDAAVYIQAVVDKDAIIGRGSFCHQGSYVGRGIRIGQDRYVEPGRRILTQVEADFLPQLPDALREMKARLLELNLSHVQRHISSSRFGI